MSYINIETMDLEPDLDDEVYEDDIPESPTEKPILSKSEQKILAKYKDLDIVDEQEEKEMVEMREDRRKFSERLEEDPIFRAKYIAHEKKRREEQLFDDESQVEDIINRLKGRHDGHDGHSDHEPPQVFDDESMTIGDTEMDEELDDLFGIDQKTTVEKPGVFIQNVNQLTIHIHVS